MAVTVGVDAVEFLTREPLAARFQASAPRLLPPPVVALKAPTDDRVGAFSVFAFEVIMVPSRLRGRRRPPT